MTIKDGQLREYQQRVWEIHQQNRCLFMLLKRMKDLIKNLIRDKIQKLLRDDVLKRTQNSQQNQRNQIIQY